MKYLTLLLLVSGFSLNATAASDNCFVSPERLMEELCPDLVEQNINAKQVRTVTISGKVFRPIDTLVLLKPFEDARYNGLKIPIAPDSTFKATFTVDCNEEYELIFLSEFRNGGWRPIGFFTDADNITFRLYDMANSDNNIVSGSPLTQQKAQYKQDLMTKWHPEYLKFEEKVKAGMSDSLLKIMQDSIGKAMAIWRHQTLKEYPKEVALSEYYDALIQYQDNEQLREVLKGQHAYWMDQPKVNSTAEVIEDLYYTNVEELIGKPLKDFHLIDDSGDSSLFSTTITDDGFVLLDLWSPWCGPCIKKSRQIMENIDELRAQSVNVISVMGGIKTQEKFLKDKARFVYPWSVYPEINNAQKIWQRYGFSYGGGGQVLIDGQGIIRAINPTLKQIVQLTK